VPLSRERRKVRQKWGSVTRFLHEADRQVKRTLWPKTQRKKVVLQEEEVLTSATEEELIDSKNCRDWKRGRVSLRRRERKGEEALFDPERKAVFSNSHRTKCQDDSERRELLKEREEIDRRAVVQGGGKKERTEVGRDASATENIAGKRSRKKRG